MSKVTKIRGAVDRYRAATRTHRQARAHLARLEADLRFYTSESERADMNAILARYPESEARWAWDSMAAGISRAA